MSARRFKSAKRKRFATLIKCAILKTYVLLAMMARNHVKLLETVKTSYVKFKKHVRSEMMVRMSV